MSRAHGPISVGVDIGTTAVKALAVDEDGGVVARSRVAHRVLAAVPDELRHDARRAWRSGPRTRLRRPVGGTGRRRRGLAAAVAVASMVPSLTAVDRRGVPVLPGLLYGDLEGRPAVSPAGAGASRAGPEPSGAMVDTEGFLRWAHAAAPDAAGYWPCQAVATHALAGVPAVDTGVTASMGPVHSGGSWNDELLDAIGVERPQLPLVVPMGQAGGTLPGTDTVFAGGSIDALCDQVVAGADVPGDVHVIFGATLIVWVVSRGMDGGAGPDQLSPYHPGPVPHRRAEQCRCACSSTGPAA